jgi:hypothetical protein
MKPATRTPFARPGTPPRRYSSHPEVPARITPRRAEGFHRNGIRGIATSHRQLRVLGWPAKGPRYQVNGLPCATYSRPTPPARPTNH